MPLGSYLAEHQGRTTPNVEYAVSGIGMAVSFVLCVVFLLSPQSPVILVLSLLLASVGLWMYLGPLNAMIANVVPTRIRTRAFSVSLFLSHALGDAISPSVIGELSDSSDSLTQVSFAFYYVSSRAMF